MSTCSTSGLMWTRQDSGALEVEMRLKILWEGKHKRWPGKGKALGFTEML